MVAWLQKTYRNGVLMKLATFLLLSLMSLSIFAADLTEVTHYKYYPKTPAVEYQGDTLDFYSVKNEYGEFSNFAKFPLFIDGKWWPTSEHYYQAMKFLDEERQEIVRNIWSAYKAAQYARKQPLREEWEEVKEGFMWIALYHKYTQHDDLRELLLSTSDAHIYEHTTYDCYWADCGDKTGLNRLGEMLMDMRDVLKTR